MAADSITRRAKLLLAATILGGGSISAANALGNTMAVGDFMDVGKFALAANSDTDLSLIPAEGIRIEGDVKTITNVRALSSPALDVAGIADAALRAAGDPTVFHIAEMLSRPEGLWTLSSGVPNDLTDISVSGEVIEASVVAPTERNPDNDGILIAIPALAASGFLGGFVLLAIVNRRGRKALARRVNRIFGRRGSSLIRRYHL